VLACARRWKLLAGVRRAALAAVYPTELRRGDKDDPFSLILDVGATIDASAEDLVTFAVMGSAYARLISQNRRPRVALLSNGAEAGKGPQSVVHAHELLLQTTELNFIGNIEGLDIPRGVADVVVCSGFVGNVVLKMLEGISETMVRLARYAHKEKLTWRLGLVALKSAIDQLKELYDWEQYGGAPLLGFEHLFIKAHGRSSARAITNAIKVANKALTGNLTGNIARTMAELDDRRARATATS
jgi:glycerol-3-phosphate acyltransferase PlsX